MSRARHAPPAARRTVRLGPFGVFALSFLLLLGSAVAMGVAQFRASHLAPWLSIGLSLAAVACTVLALRMRPPR